MARLAGLGCRYRSSPALHTTPNYAPVLKHSLGIFQACEVGRLTDSPTCRNSLIQGIHAVLQRC